MPVYLQVEICLICEHNCCCESYRILIYNNEHKKEQPIFISCARIYCICVVILQDEIFMQRWEMFTKYKCSRILMSLTKIHEISSHCILPCIDTCTHIKI